nr:twin-arginine translocase TatA/TatE family subunit [Isoptericola sediminis]
MLVVLLFGANRLPDVARSVGSSLKIFKKEIKDLGEDDDDNDTTTSRSTASGTTTQGTGAQDGAPSASSAQPPQGEAPAQGSGRPDPHQS